MGEEEDSRAGMLGGQIPFPQWGQGPANTRAGDHHPAALLSSSPCCRSSRAWLHSSLPAACSTTPSRRTVPPSWLRLC